MARGGQKLTRASAWGKGLLTSKIFGNAQKTGTLGHSAFLKIEALKQAMNPRTIKVALDNGYKTLFRGTKYANKAKNFTKYGPRPDIAALRTNGKVWVKEVRSKTDDVVSLISRNVKYAEKNKIQLVGSKPKISNIANFFNKIFSK